MERVVSRKLIDQLFSKGSSHSTAVFPIRVVYLVRERARQGEPVQVLVSVSKRHFKRAVKRNRAKRQMREAYRLGKQALLSRIPDDKSVAIAFIWLSDEPVESRRVARSMEKLLAKVAESVCTSSD